MRDRRRRIGRGSALQEHDRPCRRLEQHPLLGRDRRDPGRGLHAVDHQREGLRVASLPRTELLHGVVVRRVAREVVSADPLDRDDPALDEDACRATDRVARVEHGPARVHERQARPARRTRDRLRMKSAIARVVVLAAARLAHRERRHRRPCAIVRGRLDDREPRPARGAAREGVTETAVGAVGDLAHAVVADAGVGRDVRSFSALDVDRARLDPERSLAARGLRGPVDVIDARQLRRARRELVDEARDVVRVPFDLDENAVDVVADESAEGQPPCERRHEGAEPDALHHATDPQRDPRALSVSFASRAVHARPPDERRRTRSIPDARGTRPSRGAPSRSSESAP